MTVPDIIREVMGVYGYSSLLKVDLKNDDYAIRDYCVQYRLSPESFSSSIPGRQETTQPKTPSFAGRWKKEIIPESGPRETFITRPRTITWNVAAHLPSSRRKVASSKPMFNLPGSFSGFPPQADKSVSVRMHKEQASRVVATRNSKCCELTTVTKSS